MHKDFDTWNTIKQSLEAKNKNLLFKEGDIWWCSIGINLGIESCGKHNTFRRPVLVLKKLSSRAFIGIPLSTQQKFGSWFASLNVNKKRQCLLLYQIRIFSTVRFQRRLAVLEEHDFKRIKQKLEKFLELDNHQGN